MGTPSSSHNSALAPGPSRSRIRCWVFCWRGAQRNTVPANNTKHLESFSTFFLPQSPSAWFWKQYSIERLRRCHCSSATRTWSASQKATSSGWPTLTHLAAHGYTVLNASSLPTTHCPLPLLCFTQKDGGLVGFLDGMYHGWLADSPADTVSIWPNPLHGP